MFELWAVGHKQNKPSKDDCESGSSLESQKDTGPFTKHLHDDRAGCPPSKILNLNKNNFTLAWLNIK